MAYLINRYSGAELTSLDDASVDTSTSINLVGRNYTGYGELQNENFLWLMENFAGEGAPTRPLSGQLWYNTVDNSLYSYDGAQWNIVSGATVSETAPENPAAGAFWLKIPVGILYVRLNSGWLQVGPEAAEGFEDTRCHSDTIQASDGRTFPIIKVLVNGGVTGIVATGEFTIHPDNPIEGFSDIKVGYNMANFAQFTGNLEGIADRARILNAPQTINGVPFNGSTGITIKSSTTKSLRAGDHISGLTFDGSEELTWSVDASSSNVIGKIVVRDSAGDFAASTITADLIGNVTGNVTALTGTSTFNRIQATEVVGPKLSGNASSASKLLTSRNINGVQFDGTSDIDIPVPGLDVTGDTLANNVVYSFLTRVGNLENLNVNSTGIQVGDGQQIKLSVEGVRPTLAVQNETGLKIELYDTNMPNNESSITYIPSEENLSLTGQQYPAIIPNVNNTIEFGNASKNFRKIYASDFIGDLTGNADTATLAVTATNIGGGGSGAIPYQTGGGTTDFVPAGVSGQVLRSSGTGQPVWGYITFATHAAGNYLTGVDYDGFTASTWNVDATSSNVGSKVVARNSSGDFSARNIYASNFYGRADRASRIDTEWHPGGTSSRYYPTFVTYAGDNRIAYNDPSFYYDPVTNTLTAPNITGTASGNVKLTGSTMSGFLTLHSDPTASKHAATKAYVDYKTGNIDAIWAGTTTLASVIATYRYYAIGTRVAFFTKNAQALSTGNGGVQYFNDYYRNEYKKIGTNSWKRV
jgi:hypothetical protein